LADLQSRVSVLKLLKADIITNDVHIDELMVRPNYEKYDFIRNIEMRSIAVENGSVRLKLDLGNIELNKIALNSILSDYRNNSFTGNVSFEFKTGAIQFGTSFEV
jgi:hypothetical protein